MNDIYELLDGLTLDICQSYEEKSPQFLSIKKIYDTTQYPESFLPLITANALICYQLSNNGEKYWEEFSCGLLSSKIIFHDSKDIMMFFVDFLPSSDGNKRLFPTKIKRLRKFQSFLGDMYHKQKFYYKNMDLLRNKLAKVTNQDINAKTINFAVMIFGYGARIRFGTIISFPETLPIPHDSRIISIYKKYAQKGQDIDSFYAAISDTYKIPQLHLDAILWSHTQKILNGEKLL